MEFTGPKNPNPRMIGEMKIEELILVAFYLN